jgi:hypothetical protein
VWFGCGGFLGLVSRVISVSSPGISALFLTACAGKTYLCASVIDEIRQKDSVNSRVIFAFLRHDEPTTALGVLHSLIFQLARDDHILQDIVCQSTRESLGSSITTTTKLLTKLLNCSGRLHIVVDGLDEVEAKERTQLLQELLIISDACAEASVLVASRPEYDIEGLLKPKAIEIRVDSCNEGSIGVYVTSRYDDWIRCRTFTAEEKATIVELLSPVAAKSKGQIRKSFLAMYLVRKPGISLHAL